MAYFKHCAYKYKRNNIREEVHFDGLRFRVELDMCFGFAGTPSSQFDGLYPLFMTDFVGKVGNSWTRPTFPIAPPSSIGDKKP
jgi:hypothetical protein